MKKFGLLTVLLMGCLLLIGCKPSGTGLNEANEEFISYYDNGAIREKGTYIDGIKEGTWTTYDEGGNIIDIREYKNGNLIVDGEEVYDIANDEKLLSLYPGVQERGWNIIIGDILQTNYVNGTDNLYYDPYRGFALKVGAEFDGGLIREVDIDEYGCPHSEITFLVKGEENEENRTGINGYREMFTISAISKQNLENFGITSDFSHIVIGEKLEDFPDAIIGENNQFIFTNSNPEYLSGFQIFDVEERL